MDGYTISEAAERSGFSASTLRFYEQSGLVRPSRTASGYRSYDDRHLELLAFIGRAKGFGLRLDEVADLLALLDDERCAPVQQRLRELVDAKLVDAQARLFELAAFTAELRRVATHLRGPASDGPCDASCSCTTDPLDDDDSTTDRPPLALSGSAGDAAPAIACTLSADQVGDRLIEWRGVLSSAVGRDPIVDGMRVRVPADVDVAALARLAIAEQSCCPFLTFAIVVDHAGVALDVTGPDDAQPVIRALVGVAG